jgi:hypothetical protein
MDPGNDDLVWGEPSPALDHASLSALLRREIAAIRVPGAASPEECTAFVRALKAAPGRAADTSPMRLVGSNFSNHHGDDKSDYFATVAASREALERIVAGSFDPVERVLTLLRAHWPGGVAIAYEGPPHGRYFAGCVKTRIAGSALHYDYAPDMVSGYAISAIRQQLSWNVYLEMPGDTGETTLYDRLVDASTDLVQREPGALARWENLVSPQAVAHCSRYTFKGAPGELVMFNTRCPHSIAVENAGENERRTQIGGFAGLTPQGDFILWS